MSEKSSLNYKYLSTLENQWDIDRGDLKLAIDQHFIEIRCILNRESLKTIVREYIVLDEYIPPVELESYELFIENRPLLIKTVDVKKIIDMDKCIVRPIFPENIQHKKKIPDAELIGKSMENIEVSYQELVIELKDFNSILAFYNKSAPSNKSILWPPIPLNMADGNKEIILRAREHFEGLPKENRGHGLTANTADAIRTIKPKSQVKIINKNNYQIEKFLRRHKDLWIFV